MSTRRRKKGFYYGIHCFNTGFCTEEAKKDKAASDVCVAAFEDPTVELVVVKMGTFPKYPVIDVVATGENILRLRKERGLTVREIQKFFGFEEPAAIYKWQRGENLPSLDNMVALARLFNLPIEDILVLKNSGGDQSDCSIVTTSKQIIPLRKQMLFMVA